MAGGGDQIVFEFRVEGKSSKDVRSLLDKVIRCLKQQEERLERVGCGC